MSNRTLTILFLIALLAGLLLFLVSTGQLHLQPLKLPTAAAFAHASIQDTGPAACCDVTGSPTISAAFINQVLAFYHSPARGLGATIYALGIKYNINPVYALAFFMHESSFGNAGVARVTLSPGNLRCAPALPCINGYRAYSSWAQGFEGWYGLIRSLYVNQWHKITVEQIVPTYAPSSDHNNVTAYITAIRNAVSSWQRGNVEVL